MGDALLNVILIGMPGAGKSTVGVVLAKIMNKHFIDTDLLVQKRHGETLQRMIDEYGAEGFIERENHVLESLDACDSIISTGGSAVYSDTGMLHLKGIGHVVYLKGDLPEISRRLGNFDERGIVFRGDGTPDLAGLMEQRGPLYERYADSTIDIDGKDVTEIALDIANLLGDLK